MYCLKRHFVVLKVEIRENWQEIKGHTRKKPEPGISGLEKTAPSGELEFSSR